MGSPYKGTFFATLPYWAITIATIFPYIPTAFSGDTFEKALRVDNGFENILFD